MVQFGFLDIFSFASEYIPNPKVPNKHHLLQLRCFLYHLLGNTYHYTDITTSKPCACATLYPLQFQTNIICYFAPTSVFEIIYDKCNHVLLRECIIIIQGSMIPSFKPCFLSLPQRGKFAMVRLFSLHSFHRPFTSSLFISLFSFYISHHIPFGFKGK